MIITIEANNRLITEITGVPKLENVIARSSRVGAAEGVIGAAIGLIGAFEGFTVGLKTGTYVGVDGASVGEYVGILNVSSAYQQYLRVFNAGSPKTLLEQTTDEVYIPQL